ncbi:hypothetical protein ACQRBF_04040 [Peptoniphilaceae bacterium SGI.131]
MRSIFELISKYKGDTVSIPLIALAAIIVIMLVYIFVKNKFIKYIIPIVTLIVGLVFLIRGYMAILTATGLSMLSTSIKILSFAGVALLFSFILDILDSLATMFKSKKNKVGETVSKKKSFVDKKETKAVKLQKEKKISEEQGETKAIKFDDLKVNKK